MTVKIVILALIAAFLALRLYSVLGRRADHGDEPGQPRFDTPQGGIGAPPPLRGAEQPVLAGRVRDLPPALPAVEKGLRDILGADRRFDPHAFVDGARAAYRMILEAFWRGDRAELAHLCDSSVAQHFAEAIAQREAAGDHRQGDGNIGAKAFTGSGKGAGGAAEEKNGCRKQMTHGVVP